MLTLTKAAKQVLDKHNARAQVGTDGLYECPSESHAEQCVDELAELYVIAHQAGKILVICEQN